MLNEKPKTAGAMLKQTFYNGMRAMPALAKVLDMTGKAVFGANRFAAWLYGIKDGLNTRTGVALSTAFGTFAFIDNFWGRAFSMYRLGQPKKKKKVVIEAIVNGDIPVPDTDIYRNATLWYPGVETTLFMRANYLALQCFSNLYMVNSIPGSYLNTISLAALIARLADNSFDANCDAPHPSTGTSIVMVHAIGTFLAYSSVSSFISYNHGQIRVYFGKLFIEGQVREIDRWTWLETNLGVLTNTVGIAFGGKHAWDTVKNQSFCHIGINNIPDTFILLWVMQSCITNYIVNGMMTLAAVHKRRTNQHEIDRESLAKIIGMSTLWDIIIRTAIFGNAISVFCSTENQVPSLPGTLDPEYQYLSYNGFMILLGTALAIVSFLNQYALSSESDVREREVRRDEILAKKRDEDELEQEEKSLMVNGHARDDSDDDDQKVDLYRLNGSPRNHAFYGANGDSNGHRVKPSVSQKEKSSGFSRILFFRRPEQPTTVLSDEDSEYYAEVQQGMNRFHLQQPDNESSWRSCNIM
jgi:hypothetical protein